MSGHERIKRIASTEVARKVGNNPGLSELAYTPDDGVSVWIDRLAGGHEYSNQEVRIELVERVGGSDTIIMAGYGQSFQITINHEVVGNGSKQIVIRLINGDPSSLLHMTGLWEGHVYV